MFSLYPIPDLSKRPMVLKRHWLSCHISITPWSVIIMIVTDWLTEYCYSALMLVINQTRESHASLPRESPRRYRSTWRVDSSRSRREIDRVKILSRERSRVSIDRRTEPFAYAWRNALRQGREIWIIASMDMCTCHSVNHIPMFSRRKIVWNGSVSE